jgi:hypothetical protein
MNGSKRKRATAIELARKRIVSSSAKVDFWEKLDSMEVQQTRNIKLSERCIHAYYFLLHLSTYSENMNAKCETAIAQGTKQSKAHAERFLFRFCEQYMHRKQKFRAQ